MNWFVFSSNNGIEGRRTEGGNEKRKVAAWGGERVVAGGHG